MSDEKTLAYDDYLKLKGLYHMAVESLRACEQYAAAMHRITGTEEHGHLDDAICNYGTDTLERGLEREGFAIPPPSPAWPVIGPEMTKGPDMSEPDYSALVARLRFDGPLLETRRAAADAIEALQKRVGELEEECDDLLVRLDYAGEAAAGEDI